MNNRFLIFCALNMLSYSISYSNEKPKAGSVKECSKVCSILDRKGYAGTAVCMASCLAKNGLSTGVSCGDSSATSSSYPSGGSTGGSSSSASSQAGTWWAWGGVNGRDKIYFSSYEEQQDYLYKNSGNCGGE